MMESKFKNRLQRSTGLQMLLLTLLLGALILASAGLGYLPLGFGEVARILAAGAAGIPGLTEGLDPVLPVVVWEVRLPRILTAAIVGGGLAVAGAVYQGVLLNPLADPYTLGVSAGAAFGAALALLLGIDFLGAYSVPLCAFIGAAGTLAVVVYLSAAAGGPSCRGCRFRWRRAIFTAFWDPTAAARPPCWTFSPATGARLRAPSATAAGRLAAIRTAPWPPKSPWYRRIFTSTFPSPPRKSS